MQNFMPSTQPRPADNIELYSDASTAARFGLVLLGVGFGGFLLWAALAPLDSGVPTQGTVTVDTKRKAVQHFSGGIIKEVLVREGDQVVEGQTLMVLDEDLAKGSTRWFGKLLPELVHMLGLGKGCWLAHGLQVTDVGAERPGWHTI